MTFEELTDQVAALREDVEKCGSGSARLPKQLVLMWEVLEQVMVGRDLADAQAKAAVLVGQKNIGVLE